MLTIIRAERLKCSHTFGRNLPIIAPVITFLLVFVMTGKCFPGRYMELVVLYAITRNAVHTMPF